MSTVALLKTNLVDCGVTNRPETTQDADRKNAIVTLARHGSELMIIIVQRNASFRVDPRTNPVHFVGRHAMRKFGSALTASLAFLAMAAFAEEETGRQEYMVACAGCHGESAMGDGPLAGLLNIETPNLTTLATEKGDGTFPFQYVLWMIDGRNIIRAHGDAMPIWGERYQVSATSQRGETAEMVARGRILSLVYYLESIQQ